MNKMVDFKEHPLQWPSGRDKLLDTFNKQLKANGRVITPHSEMPQCPNNRVTGEVSSREAIAHRIAKAQATINRRVSNQRAKTRGVHGPSGKVG